MRPDPASTPDTAPPPVSDTAPMSAAAPASTDAAASSAQAVEHLFRYASRAGRVHPLQHLLQRYRAGERA